MLRDAIVDVEEPRRPLIALAQRFRQRGIEIPVDSPEHRLVRGAGEAGALIVRGADTARHDLAPEAAGLHAISLGLSALAGDDDHGLLERGFVVYDALFAWARHAADERHNWPAKKTEKAA